MRYPVVSNEQYDLVVGGEGAVGVQVRMKYAWDLISIVRNWRKEANIPEKEHLPIKFGPTRNVEVVRESFSHHKDFIQKLARVSSISEFDADKEKGDYVLAGFEGRLIHELDFDVILAYERTIDVPAERDRLTKDIAKYEKGIAAAERQLGNPSFLAKAPANVIEGLKRQAAETRLLLDKARAALESLPPE
jgi:valyl-tRNA synthetase